MINNAPPNSQNSFRQIVKLISCIAAVFSMVVMYARYGRFLDIEYLAEGILFLLLASILWLYRVDNYWKFTIEGNALTIQLSYNFFLRGSVSLEKNGKKKRHSCWIIKGVELPLTLSGATYSLRLKRQKSENFFTCSLIKK